VTLGIGRDATFDQSGNLIAVVSATANGATLAESNGTGQTVNTTNCNTVGQSAGAGNNGAPQAGCPTGTPWTTDAAPLNGGSVKIVSVPNSASEKPLSDTATNNIPVNNTNGQPTAQSRTFVVHLTDQFGNLTSGGSTGSSANNAGLPTLSSTGVGTLAHCTGGSAYNNTSTCNNATGGSNSPAGTGPNANGGTTTTTDANGVTTVTFPNVRGSYLAAFSSAGAPTQDRYIASNIAVICNPFPFCGNTAGQFGTQTIVASWNAPTDKFNTFTAGSAAAPAIATYTAGSSTMTDTVKINWYNQNSKVSATFTTTPSNKVKPGVVVTVSATVLDQFGNPVQGDNVTFVRSGPNPNNGTDCSATNGAQNTNASGQAGFTFTCNTAGVQHVTVVVTDGSGNELARGVQTITFTGRIHITATINCFSPRAHHITCKVHVSPKISGLVVDFFNKNGKNIHSDDTNKRGNAFMRLSHKKSGKHYRFAAHVKRSSRTFGADAGSDGVTVK